MRRSSLMYIGRQNSGDLIIEAITIQAISYQLQFAI